MQLLHEKYGTFHFIGIGGIGMSGIAEILHRLDYTVQGSDASANYNTKRLTELGVKVQLGHDAANIGDAKVIVVSSAIKADNPELQAAKAQGRIIIKRAEMLAELMRLKQTVAIAGTHGKTTTTTLVASLFASAKLDPTIINGGIINAIGSNAALGSGDWLIAEADESDGSFLTLPTTVAVVTNIDPEHMENYGSFDAVRAAYLLFVERIPFYGFGVLCYDHAETRALAQLIENRRIITYGLMDGAKVQAVNLQRTPEGTQFDVIVHDAAGAPVQTIHQLHLPMVGDHNVQNALVPVVIALELGLAVPDLQQALANFTGVKRRFTKTGSANGVTVIDDYGHHPVEIKAVLKAAKQATSGQIIAVMQPHRYSRLSSLFADFCTCFADADTVIIADVFAAGETPIKGADQAHLVAGIKEAGKKNVYGLSAPEQLPALIHELASPGDYVICLGAGSITNWAYALPSQLEELAKTPAIGAVGA